MIGPNFPRELEAAGLLGLRFSWDAAGNISGRQNLNPAQNAALDAVLAAHDPNATPLAAQVLPQDIMAQFTSADVTAIQAAIAGNPQLWLLWNAFLAQKDAMQITNARFIAGWSALVSILGAPRMTAIAAALGIETPT